MEDTFKMRDCEYRALPYISSSDIKNVLYDEVSYKLGIVKKENEALLFGRVVHSLTLEPDSFENEFLLCDREVDLRVKKDKDYYSELEKEAKELNKTLIRLKDYNKAKEISEAILNSEVGSIFKGGMAEICKIGDVFGKKCKAKADYIKNDCIIDLKTTTYQNSSEFNFSKVIYQNLYHVQAAFYKEMFKKEKFLFVVVEKESPYRIGVYELGDASIEIGKDQIKRAYDILENLDNITNVRKYNGSLIRKIELPKYAFMEWE